jgi:hypothetical protein
MKRLMSGAAILSSLAVTVACSDPTGDLRNGPERMVTTPRYAFIDLGTSKVITVQVLDEQGNPLATPVSVLSSTAGVVTVAVDDSFRLVHPDPHVSAFKVSGDSIDAARVIFASGSLRDTLTAVVVPTSAPRTATLSTTTPTPGEQITLTAPGNFLFTPESKVVTAKTGVEQPVVSVATDSTSLVFVSLPGTDDTVEVSNAVLKNNPNAGSFSLRSSAGVFAAPLDGSALFSTTTPNVNTLVTATMPAGYKALPEVSVAFGSDLQTVVSVAADSSSFVFRAHQAGASGPVTLNNVVYSSLTDVALSGVVAQGAAATVGATIVTLTGADAIATAPLIAIPGPGQTSGVIDNEVFSTGADCTGGTGGGAACLIYKFVLTEETSFTVTANWLPNITDVGIYFSDDTNTDPGVGACDSHGRGATAAPEVCTIDPLPAGTWYMQVTSYGPLYPQNDPNPTSIDIKIANP